MSHGDLISMAQTLAQEHPEVLQGAAQRFPEAQGFLDTALSDASDVDNGQGGSLLGRLFGG